MLRISLASSAVILALGLGFVASSGKQHEADHVDIRLGKTVRITASYNYCWYPTIHRFPTGEIMATVRTSPDDANPEGEFSAYCISKNGGQTWSRRYTMGAGANIDASYSQEPLEDAIWVLGAGYLSLEPDPSGRETDLRATLTEFSRAGEDVHQIRDASIHLSEAPQLVPVKVQNMKAGDASKPGKLPAAVPQGAIIAGPGGEWLSTLYYTTRRDPRLNRLVLIRSFDHGRTWKEYGIIAAVKPNEKPWTWMGSEGPNESGLVRLPDGKLLCIYRTGNPADMGEAWSSDDGKTWSTPVSIGFKGVAPHLRAMSNGVLVCTFGRPGVNIMFSTDGGESWQAVTPIFTGQGTGYSDVVEVSPGKLLVVYDSLPRGGDPVPGSPSEHIIQGTFVEVEKR